MGLDADDWAPTADWPTLRLRAQMRRKLDQFFLDRGFLHVETPILSADTVVDRHLDPMRLAANPEVPDPESRRSGEPQFLQTSPEFHMKRLLAAGAPAIYQITKAFREGESGPWHNPEFTIVEWYRPGDTVDMGMQLLSDVGQALFDCPTAKRMTYGDAFQTILQLAPHRATVQELRAVAERQHSQGAPPWQPIGPTPLDRDGWLEWLWADRIQPHLGHARPVIVHDYPASQAALAQLREGTPPTAERFELFYRGVELANGYHELRDADQLEMRSRQANQQRQADGKTPLPCGNRLTAAMRHGLPDCCGVALGFDRAVMLVAEATSIAQVMPFPWSNA